MQRIVLARALLAGAAVPVLDQPEGAPRPEDGERLIEDVFSAAGNQTVLPITHRSEGVDRVDRVVSMAGG